MNVSSLFLPSSFSFTNTHLYAKCTAPVFPQLNSGFLPAARWLTNRQLDYSIRFPSFPIRNRLRASAFWNPVFFSRPALLSLQRIESFSRFLPRMTFRFKDLIFLLCVGKKIFPRNRQSAWPVFSVGRRRLIDTGNGTPTCLCIISRFPRTDRSFQRRVDTFEGEGLIRPLSSTTPGGTIRLLSLAEEFMLLKLSAKLTVFFAIQNIDFSTDN